MLNPEEIRNESFSLLPTGYSPEQVDAVLNEVADAVTSGKVSDLTIEGSFELTDVGYAPPEVDAFFSTLRAQLSAHQAAQSAEAVAEAGDGNAPGVELVEDATEATAAGPEEAHDEEGDSPQIDTDDVSGDEDEAAGDEERDSLEIDVDDKGFDEGETLDDSGDGVFAAAPTETSWQAPSDGVLDLDQLCQAVDRTGETLASLRGFIDNEVSAMKLAVERQAHETAKRCEQLIAEAVAEATLITEAANTEISRANEAAHSAIEKERRELAKELKRMREECDAEVARKHTEADDYATNTRAEADKDRAEAQRTIENAIGMQASIAESLERARQQLTPSEQSDDQLAA